jgi:hypothetical protein
MHAPVSNWVCDHPRACVLTFGAIIERWPKASTCQEISVAKENIGLWLALAGKMPGNPFWKEIDRKYDELPGKWLEILRFQPLGH